MSLLVQSKLENDGTFMVTWLPIDKRVKVGSRITLDGEDDTVWTVVWQSNMASPGEFNRKWGLDLPKSQRTER